MNKYVPFKKLGSDDSFFHNWFERSIEKLLCEVLYIHYCCILKCLCACLWNMKVLLNILPVVSVRPQCRGL